MDVIEKLTDLTEIAEFIRINSYLINTRYDLTFKRYESEIVKEIDITPRGYPKILNRYILCKNHNILKLHNNTYQLVLTIQDQQLNDRYNVEIDILTAFISHNVFDKCSALIIDERKIEITTHNDKFYISYQYNKAAFFKYIYDKYIDNINNCVRKKEEQLNKRRKADKKRSLLNKTKNINECSVCLDSKECYKYFCCFHNNLCSVCFKKISVKICPLCRSN